ncbi:MAG: hypothetical protein OXC54_05800 [Rhodospirillaceae bacterium]|nr:hypothetical protein [Rhodospirillaceae bacterium]
MGDVVIVVEGAPSFSVEGLVQNLQGLLALRIILAGFSLVENVLDDADRKRPAVAMTQGGVWRELLPDDQPPISDELTHRRRILDRSPRRTR